MTISVEMPITRILDQTGDWVEATCVRTDVCGAENGPVEKAEQAVWRALFEREYVESADRDENQLVDDPRILADQGTIPVPPIEGVGESDENSERPSILVRQARIEKILSEVEAQLPPDERKNFALEILPEIERWVSTLSDEFYTAADEETWAEVKPMGINLRNNAEALRRRLRLQRASEVEEEEIKQNLFWMSQYGTEEDLVLVRRLKRDPAVRLTDSTRQLIENVQTEIRARTEKRAANLPSITPETLGELVDELREMTGFYPLTVIVDGWQHPAAQTFLAVLDTYLQVDDVVWRLGEGPASEGTENYLDMTREAARSRIGALAADLLFVAAEDEEELATRLGRWRGRTWLLLISAPRVAEQAMGEKVTPRGFQFIWSP